jgi:two-component system nitrogen regulation sensor histidine kinase GlnL
MIIKRFLIIALISTALSFSLLLFIVARRETALLEKAEANKSRLYAESVATVIKNAMSSGQPEAAKKIVGDLNGKGEMKVAVYRYDGSLAFGDSGETHLAGSLAIAKEVRSRNDNAAFFLYPVLNEAGCHRCHQKSRAVIGAVAVRMPVNESDIGIAHVGKNLVLFGILLVLSASAAVFMVAKKMLLDPLASISQGVEAVRKGDLEHRIALQRNDELGDLAVTFNQMAETVEKAHLHMEQAIRQKTTELRVTAELSTEVFRGNLPLKEIIERFLDAIIGKMGYEFSVLCLLDKETGMLSREFRKGLAEDLCAPELSLAGDHPIAKALREALPAVKKQCDIGTPAACAHVAVIPILSHQRERCRQVNLCSRESCPAFASTDDRCWLIPNTLCRSPQCVAGKDKIYGCLHCGAFPVIGVLIAGRNSEVPKSSLHSLEVLASEMGSAIENQRFIETKKEDINKLIRLHDISVRSLQGSRDAITQSIVSFAATFSGTDAAILWRNDEKGMLHFSGASPADISGIPEYLAIADTFIGRAVAEQHPVETTDMAKVDCLDAVIRHHGFIYAAAIPLKFRETIFGCLALFKKKDFAMSESEKAFILLFANQAAAAIHSAELFASLNTEKEFSEAIFNCAGSGILVLDREGRILKINSSGADILRTDIGTVVGKKMVDLYPEAAELLSFSTQPGREVTLSLPDGSSVPIGFNNSPLSSISHGLEGIIVLFRNMTEIKQLQEALKKKAHFDTMNKVISGVAHEVRNPLFGISSIGQILDRELASPQHKTLIQAMLKETDRMRRLIEELLLYTRPSKLAITSVSFQPLFDELKAYVHAKKDSINFSMDIEPGLSVNADRDKLIQVFLNLLNNAIDAARSRITVAAGTSTGRVSIAVSDDGAGLREEDIDRAFDPFFTTKKGGTGLGLPICRKIIEDHGGQVVLQSSPEAGTTVTVIFAAQE